VAWLRNLGKLNSRWSCLLLRNSKLHFVEWNIIRKNIFFLFKKNDWPIIKHSSLIRNTIWSMNIDAEQIKKVIKLRSVLESTRKLLQHILLRPVWQCDSRNIFTEIIGQILIQHNLTNFSVKMFTIFFAPKILNSFLYKLFLNLKFSIYLRHVNV